MDLLFLMVKRKKYFLNPISRQNFANAFAETPNLNLEVRLKALVHIFEHLSLHTHFRAFKPSIHIFEKQLGLHTPPEACMPSYTR